MGREFLEDFSEEKLEGEISLPTLLTLSLLAKWFMFSSKVSEDTMKIRLQAQNMDKCFFEAWQTN